jgi:hypothetical protein
MIRRFMALIFSLAVLFSIQASAQTVDELIKKNIEARGGLQKIKAVKSTKVTGKIIQQGMEIPITVHQKRPGFFRVDVTFQGKTQTQAYDGETGWKIDPFQGSSEPEKMSGDELKSAQEEADMDGPLINYKEKGHAVELMGKEDMEGTPAYKLKLTLKSGDIRYIYLDSGNHLELKTSSKRKTPGGELEIDSYPGNYKPVNGLMMAHSIESKIKGQTLFSLTVDKVEMDVPIDDAMFKMPVKAPEKKPSGF